MKIKWGSIVVDGRGKLGGQVYSKNRSGSYVRNKVTPVNPRTSFQQEARQQLGALSSQWRELTQLQRDAWNGAVDGYMDTNIFGDSVKPTGKNLFTGLNRNLANIGETAIDIPAQPQDFPVISITNLTIDAAKFFIEMTEDVPSDQYQVLVFATPPVSPGKDFVSSEYRMIEFYAPPAALDNIDATEAYQKRFGVPTSGQKVFVRIVLVSSVSGQKGTPVTSSSIVL